VHLTLLAGQHADLLAFARQLRANVPFVIEPRGRVERGYALREGNVVTPVKAGHLSLAREMSVADACCTIARACLAQFEANQRGMLASADTEFLHQMRVALRRLRSAVGLFQYAIPQHAWSTGVADMRWLGRALGPARDWDVLMTERLPEMKRQFRHEAGMEELLHECTQSRLRALERARRAVRSARCQCFLLAFMERIEGRGSLR
jgi:CHAD domain-containing protein